MAVRLNITKKGKIIILVSLMFLFAGTGGYLLWRVNQEDTIAPGNSEAGSSSNGACFYCCNTSYKPSNCKNDLTYQQIRAGWACSSSGYVYCDENASPYCKNSTKTVTCGDGTSIPVPTNRPNANGDDLCPPCYHSKPGHKEPVGGVDCNKGSQCDNICYWPEVAYCASDGTCTCKSGSSNGCSDSSPKCTPVCDGTKKTAECSARCTGCDNLYYYKITCGTNTCDTGAWVTKPTGTYKYCDEIKYAATATDKDGIQESSIKVKLSNTDRTTFAKNTNGTTTTISETLSNNTNCLVPGTYTLDLSWADKKGATSTNCALNTTFTIQTEQTNPNWQITKNVVELCKDENTPNPKSELTYTITIKNTGNGEGTITKIVDTLDTKVIATYINNISNEGIFGSGIITWTLTDGTFDPAEQRTYIYKVTVPKDGFGKYVNTVTAYPSEGSNLIANAEITADCVVEAPDTGIFDSTWSKIIAGIVLITFGISYNKLVLFSRKLRISILDMQEEVRKKNFEKRVVKK